MAKNVFTDWDGTASNNTDVGGIGILGTNQVSNFDDALRTVMAQLASGVDPKTVFTSRTSAYTPVKADNNKFDRYTAAVTVPLTAAATLTANWHYTFWADGADIVIDPNGAETINGNATLTLKNGEMVIVYCTGTAFLARVSPGPQTYVTKSGNYTGLETDFNSVIRFSASATFSIDVTANLRTGWYAEIWADGGTVTIDPNSTDTINGATTLVLQQGQKAKIFKTGSTTFQAGIFGDTLSGAQTQGLLYGLTLANNATDSTNDIDVSAGSAAAAAAPYGIMALAGMTKRLDAGWSVGTNQGGLDTGSIANGTYHTYLIKRSDTGVVDVCFSASATSPTTGGSIPVAYDQYRRIGSFVRVSAAISQFIQVGDTFTLQGASNDSDVTNPGTAAVSVTLPQVPTGLNLMAFGAYNLTATTVSTAYFFYISSLLIPDAAPNATSKYTTTMNTTAAAGTTRQGGTWTAMTNTSAQVRQRSNASDAAYTVRMNAQGWIDTRGRL